MKESVMNYKAFFLGFALLGSAEASGRTYDFVTPSYGINIVANCAEGNVTCNNVTYVGRHLKTGQTIRLRGQTVHTLCADKVTPCRFLGYSFRNGTYRYFVGESPAVLEVWRGKTLILSQNGQWK